MKGPRIQSLYSSPAGMDMCVRKPLIASCSTDKSVRLWNYNDRTCELVKWFPDEVFSIAIHPSGLQASACPAFSCSACGQKPRGVASVSLCSRQHRELTSYILFYQWPCLTVGVMLHLVFAHVLQLLRGLKHAAS